MTREEYALELAREHIHWCHRHSGNHSALDRHLEAIGSGGAKWARRGSHAKLLAFAAAWLSLGLDVPEEYQTMELRRAA
jgi:hypothetical protein